MVRNRDTPVTVAELIAEGADVYCSCQWCGNGRRVRLERIRRVKGPDYLLLDRLPLCETPGCFGVRRFRDRSFTVQGHFLSPIGQRAYEAHRDWMLVTETLVRRGWITVEKA